MYERFLALQPIYCESHHDALFGGPLNAITNITFFVAAMWIYRMLRREHGTGVLYAFPILLLLVGIGSTLWHTARHPVTLLLDAVPIHLFLLLFLFVFLTRLSGRRTVAVLLTIGLLLLQVLISIATPPGFLNGSIRHVVAVMTFAILVAWSFRHNKAAPLWFIAALLTYASAIFLRSIDQAVCQFIPVGTHFLWHLLTPIAAVLGVRGLLLSKGV